MSYDLYDAVRMFVRRLEETKESDFLLAHEKESYQEIRGIGCEYVPPVGVERA